MTTTAKAFVAVLRQNVRTPIVYGFGTTAQDALDDAKNWTDGPASDLETFPCSAALFDRLNGAEDSPMCEIVDGVACVAGND